MGYSTDFSTLKTKKPIPAPKASMWHSGGSGLLLRRPLEDAWQSTLGQTFFAFCDDVTQSSTLPLDDVDLLLRNAETNRFFELRKVSLRGVHADTWCVFTDVGVISLDDVYGIHLA